MGQITSSRTSDCAIDMLHDDALIAIFSFLTLYERLMILRVSKRCNRLLSNPQSWTEVDFWQVQQVRRKKGTSRKTETWMFPANQDAVLDFMKRYTRGSLKSIYLKVVSDKILSFLCQNCPNLKVISFISSNKSFESANILDLHTFPETLPLSGNTEVCQLSLNMLKKRNIRLSRLLDEFGSEFDEGNIGTLSEDLLNRLRVCKNLRCLTLHGLFLTSTGITTLSENHQKEMRDLSLLNVRVPLQFQHIHPIDQALTSLFMFSKLISFRFSTDEFARELLDVGQFLRDIGKWKNLKHLGLNGIMAPSRDTFVSMISGLPHLKTLELEGRMLSDENIHLIAENLKNLTCLELTNGNYTPTGIKALSGHLSIEQLSLLEHHQPEPSTFWLLAVYEVILSLPKISYVKLIGNRLIALHAKEKIPKMKRNVKIDVENSLIVFDESWWNSGQFLED